MLATETSRSAATHRFTVACLTTQRGPTALSKGTPASIAEIFITIVSSDDVRMPLRLASILLSGTEIQSQRLQQSSVIPANFPLRSPVKSAHSRGLLLISRGSNHFVEHRFGRILSPGEDESRGVEKSLEPRLARLSSPFRGRSINRENRSFFEFPWSRLSFFAAILCWQNFQRSIVYVNPRKPVFSGRD